MGKRAAVGEATLELFSTAPKNKESPIFRWPANSRKTRSFGALMHKQNTRIRFERQLFEKERAFTHGRGIASPFVAAIARSTASVFMGHSNNTMLIAALCAQFCPFRPRHIEPLQR